MKLKNIWIQDIYLLHCASLSLSLKDTNKKRTSKYTPYYRYGLQNFWAFVHESLIPTQSSVHIFFLENNQRARLKKRKTHRPQSIICAHTNSVLNYMQSYFITMQHVRNSNWSWCLSAVFGDKIPWVFLSLVAKGETYLY